MIIEIDFINMIHVEILRSLRNENNKDEVVNSSGPFERTMSDAQAIIFESLWTYCIPCILSLLITFMMTY
jgi:hypothetical protein